MSWVVHLPHFLDEDGLPAPGRPGRLAAHFGRIAKAASAGVENLPFASTVPCRMRPGHKPCPGPLIVMHRSDGTIEWQCARCSYDGFLTGWQGTVWDFSDMADVDVDDAVITLVSEEEHRLLYDMVATSRDTAVVIAGAVRTPIGIEISASPRQLELLAGDVAFCANHERNRAKQGRLLALFDRLTVAAGGL